MRIRHVLIAVGLGAAPAALAVTPAGALAPGQTVCYDTAGNAYLNPADPGQYEHCVTRPPRSGSGGGNYPSLCEGTINYSTGEYTYGPCTPVEPLQG
jgi:hypothetical protein